MELHVPLEKKEETIKCKHNFACLKSDVGIDKIKPMCPIDYANGHNVLFLINKERRFCSYLIPFGYGYVCRCPTHFAIYAKYGF